MVLRPGNAGSNTAADHLSVLDQALTQIPDRWRSKTVLIRADGAGYSHALIAALSEQQLDFSVGKTVTEAVRDAIGLVPTWASPMGCESIGHGLRRTTPRFWSRGRRDGDFTSATCAVGVGASGGAVRWASARCLAGRG